MLTCAEVCWRLLTYAHADFIFVILSMVPGDIEFDPEEFNVKTMIDCMLENLLTSVASVQRILYLSVFKVHFDNRFKITGPHLTYADVC